MRIARRIYGYIDGDMSALIGIDDRWRYGYIWIDDRWRYVGIDGDRL